MTQIVRSAAVHVALMSIISLFVSFKAVHVLGHDALWYVLDQGSITPVAVQSCCFVQIFDGATCSCDALLLFFHFPV